MIYIKFKHFIFIILFINIFSINVYSENKDTEDIVKIGVYEYEPYIVVDSNGNISGYVYDLVALLNEKINLKYEYVVCSLSEGYEKLKNGDIDIMLGVPITESTTKNFIFNNNAIFDEKFGLYTKKSITLDSLKKFSIVRLGLVEGDYNANWIFYFFDANNINIDIAYAKTYKELEQLMEEDKIDLMVDSADKESKYKLFYRFLGNNVYVAGNKNSRDILEQIDKAIEDFRLEEESPITELYNEYFNNREKKSVYSEFVISIISISISLVLTLTLLIPRIKKITIRNKIKARIANNRYLLQYQPIYNPREKSIVGFEGLLRMVDENNKLVPPYKFIPEIEKNNMLYEISIWILEKAIYDYYKIKEYKSMCEKDFYISINISLNEVENDDFVRKYIKILSKSKLGPNKICLEIIERVKMNDLNKITRNINLLKDAGFKIAIDDFGVEYSNLDVLQKLDVDTIKVDKNFVDGIGKDTIKSETILFISRIAHAKNKSVVLEGVEDAEQHTEIKKIENEYLYVQGYYYNKPMHIESIANL